MSKRRSEVPVDDDGEPSRPPGWMPNTRERTSLTALLNDARDQVRADARAKSLGVVVVGDLDEVFVNRAQVVEVVAALLRNAIGAVPARGRVAVTAQEFDRDLVFAVYDAGPGRDRTDRCSDFARQAAAALGGRIWTSHPAEGTLAMFAVPLYPGEN